MSTQTARGPIQTRSKRLDALTTQNELLKCVLKGLGETFYDIQYEIDVALDLDWKRDPNTVESKLETKLDFIFKLAQDGQRVADKHADLPTP